MTETAQATMRKVPLHVVQVIVNTQEKRVAGHSLLPVVPHAVSLITLSQSLSHPTRYIEMNGQSSIGQMRTLVAT